MTGIGARRTVLPVLQTSLVAIVAGGLALLALGELAHWRSSHRRLGFRAKAGGSEAIVVLGYRNSGQRANFVNRYRARAAIRSVDPAARETVMVFCGGPVAGHVPEADLLEDHARRFLGYTGRSELDRASGSTRENIENAIPLIESADTIKIVSNSLHAEKARAYLWMLRPDLAARLARGSDHRFGELTLVKPYAAIRGLRSLRRRAGRVPPP